MFLYLNSFSNTKSTDTGLLSYATDLYFKPEYYTFVSLTSHNSIKLHTKDPNCSSENDSVRDFKGSGSCSQGYLLNSDTTVCMGSIIELNSRTALSYRWIPVDRFSNATTRNPYLIIDSTRTYYLETTDYSNNLVTNPGFELGNIDFFTSYTYCDNNNCLKPLGDNGYSVGSDANYFHSYFTGHDHTTGSGNFMIINGAQPSLVVWQQTIPVKPFTKYAFGAWISTMISLSPAQIQFSINGSKVGSVYNAPVNANKWVQVYSTWNSGSATSATIEIFDILPVLEGNDFGLDDLFFGEITTCSDSIIITASQNVNLGHDSTISPDQVIVIAPSGGPYEHYYWNTGDTTQSVSINVAGDYWLAVTDANGCKSSDTIKIMNSNVFIVFPDAFTPNADGINDFFRPKASNIRNFHMSIFNRWGQFLFETNDIETGWDGLVKGEYYPSVLYVYKASYELQDAVGTKTSSGGFRLIR